MKEISMLQTFNQLTLQKAKMNLLLSTQTVNDNDNDNDIVTSPIIVHGKQFLVDDSNVIYDFHSHLPIGSLLNDNISFY
jgi:hypothetical protein